MGPEGQNPKDTAEFSAESSVAPNHELEIERFTLKEQVGFAVRTAERAGEILRENADKVQGRTYKSRTNFKIEIDDKIDRYIREQIETNFPNDTINSEEEQAKKMDSGYEWLVDPLDGTIPYTMRSSDHASVSIALARGKTSHLGVINAALKGEIFVAETGSGAFLNGEVIRVTETEELNQAVVGIDYGKSNRNKAIPLLSKLLQEDGITYPMTYGGAAASMSLVASGRLDAYVSHDLEPWDMAAAAVICSEAGAKVTNLQGKDWTIDDPDILVANPVLHQKLLELLRPSDS